MSLLINYFLLVSICFGLAVGLYFSFKAIKLI